MINTYFIPAIFSVLGLLSLRPYIVKMNLVFRLLVAYFISCLAIFVYFLAHFYLNSRTIPSFGEGYFFASIVLCLINTLVLWILIKLKKEKM